jgi:2-C-methyl-D-erythritol 4-phosphate cytidylyltransferase
MYSAIIVAAGSGTRSGLAYNKTLYLFKGVPIVRKAAEAFLADSACVKLVLVVKPEEETHFRALFPETRVSFAHGGTTRQASVASGLKSITTTHVLIHDGARPNLSGVLLQRIIKALESHDAVAPGIPVKDTIRLAKNGILTDTVARENAYFLQTPQGFKTFKIHKAHELAKVSDVVYSDDTTLYQSMLHEEVALIEGDETNIKITTKADLAVLEGIL